MMPSRLLLKFGLPLVLLGIGGFFLWKNSASAPVVGEAMVSPSPIPSNQSISSSQNNSSSSGPERIRKIYRAESERIGAVDPNPAETERRLKEVATALSTEEASWLFGRAMDRSEESDARFFAAYLLALAPPAISSASLKELALTPLPQEKNPGRTDLERQIRAQAVEGLSRQRGYEPAKDALMEVAGVQADEFLRDRAHRGLYAWRTGKPLEEQDREALKAVQRQREKAQP